MATANDVWIFLLAQDNYLILFDYDGNGNMIYQGWSIPGTASSDSGWRIKQLNYNGNNQITSIKWPSSSPAFAFVWDSRTGYTYG